jgi:7,8-dihydropterin-6-yl-methyl-4-(beta-D-ribofuranosyl)aminobenzene 5'-phosphate synthase
MRLKVLLDNTTAIDQYYLAEPGLSYLLEDDDIRILFDTGYSGLFIDNARAMGEDIGRIDALVLSHGHDDHSGGLQHWIRRFGVDSAAVGGQVAAGGQSEAGGQVAAGGQSEAGGQVAAGASAGSAMRPLLVAHPLTFEPKHLDAEPGETTGGLSIGSPVDKAELARHFELRLSAAPVQLGRRFVFLGQVPRLNNHEGHQAIGRTGDPPQPDLLADDSALVWRGADGLVIITGCSHSGIVNIIEYAMQVCGETRIVDVIGGFHLLGADTGRLDFTRQRLAALAPGVIHPCHCTDLAARIHLAAALPVREVGVGLELTYG